MRNDGILVGAILVIVLTGCTAKLTEWGLFDEEFVEPINRLMPTGIERAHDPIEYASVQITEDFFACKNFHDGKWIDITDEFLVDDPKAIMVAQLDPKRDKDVLIVEIVSPEGRIVAQERKTYEVKQQVGISFVPKKLLERGSAGLWRTNFWADGDPVGYVDFTLSEQEEGEDTGQEEDSGYEQLEEFPSEEICTPELPEGVMEVPAESK